MQIPFKKAESFHCYREITMISHNLWWTCEKRYNKALFSLLWQQRPSWNGVAICMQAAILYRIVSFKYTVSPRPLESSPYVQISTICSERKKLTHTDAILELDVRNLIEHILAMHARYITRVKIILQTFSSQFGWATM